MPKSTKLDENYVSELDLPAPAKNKKSREDQMIALAIQLAEKKLADGTAPTPIIVHYLRESSVRRDLELEKLKKENALLEQKAKSLANEDEQKRMYEEAIAAMKVYSGNGSDEDYLE